MKIGSLDYNTKINLYEGSNYNKGLASNPDKSGDEVNPLSDTIAKNDSAIRAEKSQGITECKTCSQRKYQDKSNDSSVSFQAPTHVEPGLAGGAVMAHEQEHVVNEKVKAQNEGRKVVAQSVQIFTDVCPECGKRYVSGGNTRTVTKSDSKSNTEKNSNNKILGATIDMKV